MFYEKLIFLKTFFLINYYNLHNKEEKKSAHLVDKEYTSQLMGWLLLGLYVTIQPKLYFKCSNSLKLIFLIPK